MWPWPFLQPLQHMVYMLYVPRQLSKVTEQFAFLQMEIRACVGRLPRALLGRKVVRGALGVRVTLPSLSYAVIRGGGGGGPEAPITITFGGVATASSIGIGSRRFFVIPYRSGSSPPAPLPGRWVPAAWMCGCCSRGCSGAATAARVLLGCDAIGRTQVPAT